MVQPISQTFQKAMKKKYRKNNSLANESASKADTSMEDAN